VQAAGELLFVSKLREIPATPRGRRCGRIEDWSGRRAPAILQLAGESGFLAFAQNLP
jgi:hypothetical protein